MSSHLKTGAGNPHAQSPLRWAVSTLAAALALLVAAQPASAVIIDSGDGTGNTSAPPDDPGWDHVGTPGGLTVIYLGNGWVLTANHVNMGININLQGVQYPTIAGSAIRLENGDGTFPDLKVFEIEGNPDLPDLPILPIRATTPAIGTDVTMIGRGRSRGAAIRWQGLDGWEWASPSVMRWGTNRVADNFLDVSISGSLTRSLQMDFDAGLPTPDESQAATGDSGGALFINGGNTWELGGVLFAISTFGGQPAATAIHGNGTFAADLAFYRDQIISLTRPECSDEIDNDGDGLFDFPDDDGCHSLEGLSELPDCADGIDNDGDGLVDFGEDPGCFNMVEASRENPECSDGFDNDGDTWTDFGQDPECTASWDDDESSNPPPFCGLLGIEAALFAGFALARRRRLARRALTRRPSAVKGSGCQKRDAGSVR